MFGAARALLRDTCANPPMERERRIYEAFVTMHQRQAVPTEEPCVYLQWHRETMDPGAPLVRLGVADVLDALDKDAELVRHLLHQMHTYDCRTQRIVGLVFDKRTVLSDVLK